MLDELKAEMAMGMMVDGREEEGEKENTHTHTHTHTTRLLCPV